MATTAEANGRGELAVRQPQTRPSTDIWPPPDMIGALVRGCRGTTWNCRTRGGRSIGNHTHGRRAGGGLVAAVPGAAGTMGDMEGGAVEAAGNGPADMRLVAVHGDAGSKP